MIEVRPDLTSMTALGHLVIEANFSPFIGNLQLSELQAMIKNQTIRFIYVDDVLAGFGGWIVINSDWVEVGPIFVSDKFRRQGLGRQIIELIVHIVEAEQKQQYAITRNPAVKRIFQTLGFEQRSFWQLPFSIQLFIIRKLNLRKIFRFLRKRSPEPVAHFVQTA